MIGEVVKVMDDFVCPWGIDHEPQHMDSNGYCVHLDLSDVKNERKRITWNWDTGKWEDGEG